MKLITESALEDGPGSIPSIKHHLFQTPEECEKWVDFWNKKMNHLEKSDTENEYYSTKWTYYLEIEDIEFYKYP